MLIGFLVLSFGGNSFAGTGKVGRLKKGVVKLAVALKGLPYKYGGEDIDGFDCSGFVQYCYRCFGVMIPRVAASQRHAGSKKRLKDAEPGDIAVFRLFGRYHTAIYLGNNRFIHAPKTGDIIRDVKLDNFWIKKLLFFRKIVN